jgi:hypothetical protein
MMPLLLMIAAVLPVGEKLTYRVRYGPLTAGTLTLTVAGVEEIEGESCYHLISRLQSNQSYSALFKLDDVIESDARISDLVTLRTEKHIRESHYENDLVADFDYDENLVRYSDTTQMMLWGESRDLLTLWYYFRDLDLAVGAKSSVTSHVDKKNFEVAIHVKRRESVQTRMGVFRCLVIETEAPGRASNGVVYLSDDDRRIPVVIKTRMPFGFITATLSSVHEGG